jgi:hypothetical protein
MQHKIKFNLKEKFFLLADNELFEDHPPQSWTAGGNVKGLAHFRYTGSFVVGGEILEDNLKIEEQNNKGIVISGSFIALLPELKPELEKYFQEDLSCDDDEKGKIFNFSFYMEKTEEIVEFSQDGEGYGSVEFGKIQQITLV